nr:hypothetical protein [uncultured Desulfobacter sp.]
MKKTTPLECPYCCSSDTLIFKLKKSVMKTVCKYIDHTEDLSFFSDGERRYGNMLFELCSEVFQTGKKGRPPRVNPKGVRVRVKNKGEQKHKKGRKRPKYQAPQREHLDTAQDLNEFEIHANHLKAQNAAIRRMLEAQCLKLFMTIYCVCSKKQF